MTDETTVEDIARWRDVATAIEERLADLGWNQADLVRESGVSATTIRWLQTSARTKYRQATLAKVAKALGWPGSAIKTILTTGHPPEPAFDPTLGFSSEEEAEEWSRRRQRSQPAALSG